MSRDQLMQIIDVVAFVLFVMLMSTGALLHYILPPRSGRHIDVWGLQRYEWAQLHFVISVFFVFVIVFHLILHRQFVLNMIRGERKQGFSLRFALGVISLIVIVVLGISPFF